MAILQTLSEYVRQIDARNAAYGDIPQPPAPAEQLQTLASQCRDVFGYDLPEGYLNLLAVTDGMDFNGYKLYASKTRRLAEEYDGHMEGFMEANDLWKDYEQNSDHHLLMFGETGDDLFLFDKTDHKFKITDKVGGEAYETFDTFEELSECLLKNALGLFDDEDSPA